MAVRPKQDGYIDFGRPKYNGIIAFGRPELDGYIEFDVWLASCFHRINCSRNNNTTIVPNSSSHRINSQHQNNNNNNNKTFTIMKEQISTSPFGAAMINLTDAMARVAGCYDASSNNSYKADIVGTINSVTYAINVLVDNAPKVVIDEDANAKCFKGIANYNTNNISSIIRKININLNGITKFNGEIDKDNVEQLLHHHFTQLQLHTNKLHGLLLNILSQSITVNELLEDYMKHPSEELLDEIVKERIQYNEFILKLNSLCKRYNGSDYDVQ